MKKSKKAKEESPQGSKKAVPAKKTKKAKKITTAKAKKSKKPLKSLRQTPPVDTVASAGSSAEEVDNSGVVTSPTPSAQGNGLLTVNAVICKKCGDTIYSRATNDMRWCSCSSTSIDGGFEYTKVSGNPGEFEQTTIRIKATVEELYRDWNSDEEKFGLIKKERAVA